MPYTLFPRRMQQKPLLGTQLDRSHPLAQGLVAAWLLNEGSSTRINDLAGRSAATFNGAPAWTSQPGGGALRFTAAADMVTTTPTALSANSPLTIFVVARVEDVVAANRKRAIRLLQVTNGTTAHLEFSDGTNAVISGGIQHAVGLFTSTPSAGGPTYNVNQDYSVAMTFNPGDMLRLYRDGLQVATSVSSPTTILATQSINLGNNTAGGALNLRGSLYCAYVWNRVLQADQLATLSDEPYRMFVAAPTTRLWWVPTVGGDVSTGLTGISATANVGTLGDTHTITVTGNLATGSVGNVTASVGGDVTTALTGLSAITGIGTLTPTRTKAITGTSATTSLGSLGLGARTVTLAGVSATATVGSVSIFGLVTPALGHFAIASVTDAHIEAASVTTAHLAVANAVI